MKACDVSKMAWIGVGVMSFKRSKSVTYPSFEREKSCYVKEFLNNKLITKLQEKNDN